MSGIHPDTERLARVLCTYSGIDPECMLIDANNPYHTRSNQIGAVIWMNEYNQPLVAWQWFVGDAKAVIAELAARPLGWKPEEAPVVGSGPEEPEGMVDPSLPGFDMQQPTADWLERSGLK